MTIVVFAGPSLPRRAVEGVPALAWRPPARQGDLHAAALDRPAAIALVDGYFDAVPSVWHKEILWAMARGIRVYGAASLGALRAAELDAFGMIGIGWVYERFRDGALEDDSEVALLHGPAELGFPPVTEAMVNVRATLARAVGDGILDAREAECVTSAARSVFYKQRSWPEILRRATGEGQPGPERLRRFAAWLKGGRIDRKRLDAEMLLSALRSLGDGEPPRRRTGRRFVRTAAWEERFGPSPPFPSRRG